MQRIDRPFRRHRRRGAVMVESAIVLPILFMFTIGLIVIGLGVFRYQQVAALAREGARYASVHGTQYARESNNSAATPSDVYNNAILPQAVGLNPGNLSYSVTWDANNSPTGANASSNPPGAPLVNTVSVSVTYSWMPEMYIAGPINLSSTAVMPVSY
jgi:Flp pilus assembly protein TadG